MKSSLTRLYHGSGLIVENDPPVILHIPISPCI